MAGKKQGNSAENFRGQLMLQIASGRYFRPDVEINSTLHRQTLYSNAALLLRTSVELPVGRLLGSTEVASVSTITVEAVDRLEAQRWDGSKEFMIATGGRDLVNDIAYVMSMAMNRTVSRNRNDVERLVLSEQGQRHGAASLFPELFDPMQVVQPSQLDEPYNLHVGAIVVGPN